MRQAEPKRIQTRTRRHLQTASPLKLPPSAMVLSHQKLVPGPWTSKLSAEKASTSLLITQYWRFLLATQ